MGLFDGKVALVTGGATGIGLATAKAFAKEGAKVVISGRTEKTGKEAIRTIEAAGGKAIFVQGDVGRSADVKTLIARTLETYGRLDIAFNNAGTEGTTIGRPLAEQDEDNYEAIFSANVRGVFLSMRHEIPAMLAGGGGVIVNNSSIAGLVAFPGVSLYVASKHAVIGLTKTAAVEYGKQGIRVNAVAPAAIETGMLDRFMETVPRDMLASLHPIGRLGTPEEIAAGVLWLCSPGASFVTGHTLAIDGGFTAQ
jgi:NAD(P)-dependent dehydrogenase (short-subunit alcohol dehydrogenase family)